MIFTKLNKYKYIAALMLCTSCSSTWYLIWGMTFGEWCASDGRMLGHCCGYTCTGDRALVCAGSISLIPPQKGFSLVPKTLVWITKLVWTTTMIGFPEEENKLSEKINIGRLSLNNILLHINSVISTLSLKALHALLAA